MKKHLIVILLCVCAGTISFAQSGGNTSWQESVSIGLKGGINMPRMYYFKNEALQQLPQKDTITLMGGLFVDIPLGNVLALSPEVVYLKRGTDISYEHRSGALVHYTMSVPCIMWISVCLLRCVCLSNPISSLISPWVVRPGCVWEVRSISTARHPLS